MTRVLNFYLSHQLTSTVFFYVQHPLKNYFDKAHAAHVQAYNLLQRSTLTLKDFG